MRTIASLLLLGALGIASPSFAAEPAAKPTAPANTTAPAAPAEAPPMSERQQSLLLQLSDAEANIKALNLALTRAGYKVGKAYDRIESNLTGNELMDRKGGGPVGWKDFYGRTAHEYDNNVFWDRRPRQFQKIYEANNNQIARAKEQVATLGQDQATLLARRQKHEADQARLWATLAFEQIKDREIADEPICRFKLKGAVTPDPRAELLRPFVLFLRTCDKAALDGLDSIQTDPAATFNSLAPRMNAAYTSLRTSLADALLAGALKEDDKTKADGLKTLCKQLSEECAVIADNSTNALDRDKAKEDNSKLQFRGRLQESIAKFASGVAELDVQLGQLAKTWSITPETGVATADSLRTSGGGSSSARAGQSAASTTDAEGWIKLLDPTHINEWSNGKAEKVTLGLNPRGFLNVNHTNYCWGNPAHDQIIRAKMHKFPGPPGDSASLLLRHSKGSGYNASLSGGVFTIGKSTEGKYAVLATVKREQKGGDAVQLEFAAVGDLLTLSVEGKEVMRVHDKSIQRGVAGVGAYNAQADFSDIEIKILDQNPPVKP